MSRNRGLEKMINRKDKFEKEQEARDQEKKNKAANNFVNSLSEDEKAAFDRFE